VAEDYGYDIGQPRRSWLWQKAKRARRLLAGA
jgi:hypothetical protein